MMSRGPRFSLERLEPFCQSLSMSEMLAAAGLPRSTAYRAVQVGSLSSLSADRVAVGLGRHPAEIWGWAAWWTSAASEPARWRPTGDRSRPSCSDDHADAARRQAEAERNRRRRAARAAA